jgi:purine-binding chemotaxis protein CheW
MTETERNKTSGETQLVVFALASEYYGVDIGDVREIIRMQNITRVPGAPPFVEGVINLRGKVVTVVDLRKRLELKVGEQTKDSRIVVIDIHGKDMGVIVDGVNEVLRIQLSAVEPPSSLVSNADSDYLRGIAKLATKMIILLDLNKVLGAMGNDVNASLEKVNINPQTVDRAMEPAPSSTKKSKVASLA